MAAHRTDGSQISGIHAVHIRTGKCGHTPVAQPYRHCALGHITGQGQRCGLFAVGAQDICGTGIAAALGTHVLMVEALAHHHAEIDAAQQITNHNGDGHHQNKRLF